jgi:ankyrin repeat protein
LTTGATPLPIFAAEDGSLAVVGLLLSSVGVYVNTSRDDGSTALHLATAHGHGVVVVQLLVNAADVEVDAMNNDGILPLHCAATSIGHEDVDSSDPLHEATMRIFVQEMSNGKTAFDLACHADH